MAEEFLMNAFPTSVPTWGSLSSAMEIQPTQSQSPDCFLSPPDHFESALSSMVSSPNASTSAVSGDNFIIRELIGKLGNICSTAAPPPLPPYIGGGNQSTANSCYSSPLSSPPKMGQDSFPNLPAMPGDPGFAERAARFSSFGSRSFNGRPTQVGVNANNAELGYRSNSNFGGKLQRVSSSPLLKAAGAQAENNRNSGNQTNERRPTGNLGLDQAELPNTRENSSGSGQNPCVENGSSRKRKAAPKGKTQSPLPTNSNKAVENGGGSNAKRSKPEEGGEAKTEENRGDGSKKQSNSNQKPPEPPKDYIHVRARRGQATDSHSLAERVRREKISERMKLLQDLVPGCNKVTGKALMLDEIINYVQSLQRQVEFLSMKLAAVNPRLEFNIDNLFSKDVIQPNCSAMAHTMYPLDSLAQTHYGQPHQNNITTTAVPCPMDPLNPTLHQNHAFQLPPLDAFPNGFPQIASLCEGDLQSIVQMGYGQKESGSQSQPLHGTNQTPLMKIEF